MSGAVLAIAAATALQAQPFNSVKSAWTGQMAFEAIPKLPRGSGNSASARTFVSAVRLAAEASHGVDHHFELHINFVTHWDSGGYGGNIGCYVPADAPKGEEQTCPGVVGGGIAASSKPKLDMRLSHATRSRGFFGVGRYLAITDIRDPIRPKSEDFIGRRVGPTMIELWDLPSRAEAQREGSPCGRLTMRHLARTLCDAHGTSGSECALVWTYDDPAARCERARAIRFNCQNRVKITPTGCLREYRIMQTLWAPDTSFVVVAGEMSQDVARHTSPMQGVCLFYDARDASISGWQPREISFVGFQGHRHGADRSRLSRVKERSQNARVVPSKPVKTRQRPPRCRWHGPRLRDRRSSTRQGAHGRRSGH